MSEKRDTPDDASGRKRRGRPPGDFTSKELQEDTARFLEELRRRAEQQERVKRRRKGPPPAQQD